MHRIGLANSISRNEGNDPKEALRFALDHGFEVIQIVVGRNVRKNMENREDIFLSEVRNKGTELVCHEGNNITSEIKIYRQLLKGQKKKRVVIHHSERNSKKIDKLTPEFTPLLENYHSGIERDEIEDWLSSLKLYEKVGPVLDVPRFFNRVNSMEEVVRRKDVLTKVFGEITSLERPIHLRFVDRKLEAKDRTWRALGEGVVPFEEFVTEPLAETGILEFEEKRKVLRSRDRLEKLI
ncbi:hypothetical protein AKJ47_03090 [candidate division MSBL1 archaeon SCGC-AAA261G05]|uniref:Xylose isomerase-like TIM barrel domain-containing protein n=1 Tax=candidate division MSBL1 archaeon SCGC-AAA261G05 TaxID=1698276 RepID=A0A133V930_9EURY|nr:hypothetical protein AKJ47_03090 [candidate division MSBL1 archaeon SCGC-AAA261G05]